MSKICYNEGERREMVLKFRTKEKGRNSMSDVLNRISGLSSEDVLRLYGNGHNVTTDILSIAENMGIDVFLADFSEIENNFNLKKGDVLGCIVDEDEENKLKIMLQDELAPRFDSLSNEEKLKLLRRRQRFTLAHEIAHGCLHLAHQEIKFKLDYHPEPSIDVIENVEYEANVFAGELLIPKDTLISVCKKIISPSIDTLAEIFDVSHSVMRARIKHLGLLNLIN